eukprot:827688-Pelagomonas_calceolata.AAC.2
MDCSKFRTILYITRSEFGTNAMKSHVGCPKPPEFLYFTASMLQDFTASEAIKKSLRLVITYGSLTRLQFLNALEERLGPPLKTVGGAPCGSCSDAKIDALTLPTKTFQLCVAFLCAIYAARAGELSTLEAFRKQFDDVSFEKGTEVVFSTTGKQLLTKVSKRVDNREKGMLMSPVLNRALLQVYLGPDSVGERLGPPTLHW